MENWFSTLITGWYRKNKRDLPWRNTKDPYKIWLSEIILQQTQVAQGTAYYYRFIEKYPTVKHLAKAGEDEVLKLWQGLGYYSRARNLLVTAKQVVAEHKGIFPTNFLIIKSFKGIGDYTAAAIASFAFNIPQAVVDGNVYRLLSRVFGISIPIDSGPAKKHFSELANELLDIKNPALHNQAIMEFGSQVCKPVNPICPDCVLNSKCFAFKQKRVSELPHKSKKTKVTTRYFNYLVVADKKGNLLINRRGERDIWAGLYEFLLIETKEDVTTATLFKHEKIKQLGLSKASIRYTSNVYKHVLSHQLIMARFLVLIHPKLKTTNDLIKINHAHLTDFAMARLTEKFLNDCDLKEIL